MEIVKIHDTVVKTDYEIVKQQIEITYKEVYDMAMATYNATLEYDTPNTLEFWIKNELGDAVSLNGAANSYKFSVVRADGTGVTYSEDCTSNATQLADGHMIFVVNPQSGTLKAVGDISNDYDNDTYEHIYSVKGQSHVYLRGKLNLVIVA